MVLEVITAVETGATTFTVLVGVLRTFDLVEFWRPTVSWLPEVVAVAEMRVVPMELQIQAMVVQEVREIVELVEMALILQQEVVLQEEVKGVITVVFKELLVLQE